MNVKSLLAIAGLLLCAGSAQAANYSFTDLGTLGGTNSAAFGINNAGQVVGWSDVVGGKQYATLWRAGQVSNLGALPGALNSSAVAINQAGVVSGSSYSDASSTANHAAVWNGGTVTDLDPRRGIYSEARAINSAGTVAGQSFWGLGGGLSATVWSSSGVATQLGMLGGGLSRALGLNTSEQVVGESATGQSYVDAAGNNSLVIHAALWNGTTPTDLGTLGGHNSVANAINDAGQVVGASELVEIAPDGRAVTRAVSWTGGVIKALGSLGGSVSGAQAINGRGAVVGYSQLPNQAGRRAVLWNGTQVTDLNSTLDFATVNAGWVLYSADGINDQGLIVGTAVNTKTNVSHAFLLTPTQPAGCTATYQVTSNKPLSFSVQVTVANDDATAASGWTVGWTYSALPLILSPKNAKVTAGWNRVVKAVPLASNTAIAAHGSTVFTFNSLKGKTLPTVSGLNATLGGKSCITALE